jgi:hypothetical protein
MIQLSGYRSAVLVAIPLRLSLSFGVGGKLTMISEVNLDTQPSKEKSPQKWGLFAFN